jgi:hypothetical protein
MHKSREQPLWAQIAALTIWTDAELNGLPTEKGIESIVKKTWAKIITDAKKGKITRTR